MFPHLETPQLTGAIVFEELDDPVDCFGAIPAFCPRRFLRHDARDRLAALGDDDGFSGRGDLVHHRQDVARRSEDQRIANELQNQANSAATAAPWLGSPPEKAGS